MKSSLPRVSSEQAVVAHAAVYCCVLKVSCHKVLKSDCVIVIVFCTAPLDLSLLQLSN